MVSNMFGSLKKPQVLLSLLVSILLFQAEPAFAEYDLIKKLTFNNCKSVSWFFSAFLDHFFGVLAVIFIFLYCIDDTPIKFSSKVFKSFRYSIVALMVIILLFFIAHLICWPLESVLLLLQKKLTHKLYKRWFLQKMRGTNLSRSPSSGEKIWKSGKILWATE